MNVPQAELDRFARAFHRVHLLGHKAKRQIRAGQLTLALDTVEEARGLAWVSMAAAVRAGATEPEVRNIPDETPINLLESTANRRLLSAMRAAVAAAEEVDRERGYFPDGFAAVLENHTARIAAEVEGPPGSGQE